MTEQNTTTLILAAGGVLEQQSPSGRVIALVRRARYNNEWSLPKGKQDSGETLEETALREVEEETGYTVRCTGFAGVTHYHHGRLPKVVLYWRMAPVGENRFIPSDEVQELAWLNPAEAIRRVAHEEERQMLRTLYDIT